jgi:hypothetical protein
MPKVVRFRILALAGGGVRGLFQAHFLKCVENEVGQPLSSVFDLCIGTSIGAVSAAATAAGFESAHTLDLYERTVARVFGRPVLATKMRALTSKGPLFDRKHLDEGVSELLDGRTFADTITGFACTAGELSTFKHRVFSTFDRSATQQRMPLAHAVLASCSAPIFFKPFRSEDTQEHFYDGGLWANSPALLGVDIANRQLGVPLGHIEVVSIGTGTPPKGTLERVMSGRRALSLGSLMNVIDMYGDTQADFFDDTAQGLLGTDRLLSINPPLKSGIALYDYRSARETLPALASSEFKRVWARYGVLLSPKDKYQCRDEAPLGAVEEMIRVAGLTRIMANRRQYKTYREGSGDIESYLMGADHSIEMVSISLSTGLGFEKITRVFERKLRESATFKVTVSLLNPECDHLMKTVTSSVSEEHYAKTADEFADDIRRGIDTLLRVRSEWPQNLAQRFDVRVHNALPQGSAIILDRGHERSVIQIETKPYKAPLVDSYAIEVRPAGPDGLYDTFLRAYGTLLDDGKSALRVVD